MEDSALGGIGITRRFVFCFIGLALIFSTEWSNDLVLNASVDLPRVLGIVLSARFLGVVVMLLCALLARKVESFMRHAAVLPLLACLVLVGRLLASFAGAWPGMGPALSVTGGMLYGAAESFLLLAWLALCCTMGPRQTSIVFPLAYLVAGFTYFILLAMGTLAATVVTAVLPCLSGMLCAFGLRSGAFDKAVERPHALDDNLEESAVAASEEASVQPAAQDWKFPLYPVALMVVFKLVFYFSLALTRGPSMYGPLGILVIATFAFAGAFFFFDKFDPVVMYKLALPLMVAGLLLLAWVDVGSMQATMFTNAGNIAFELFMLVALCEACYRYNINPLWMFGIVQGFSSLAGVLGFACGSEFVTLYPAGSFGANAVIMVVVVLLVALPTVFFDDRMVAKAFGMRPAAGDGGQEGDGRPATVMTYYEELVWRCATVSRQYGLSHREEEILELLAQGMSGARIEQELFISKNTVKTHVHHIYEKLGVHSRDEARLIVENIK